MKTFFLVDVEENCLNVSLGTEIQKEVTVHITDESVQKEKMCICKCPFMFFYGWFIHSETHAADLQLIFDTLLVCT